MKETQPIRELDKVKELLEWTKSKSQSDYLLILFTLYTGLRISDIVRIKVQDVLSGEFYLNEKKTKKVSIVTIQPKLIKIVKKLKLDPASYLFPSQKGGHIKRHRARDIIALRGKQIGINGLAPHSLRKTFGFHHFQKHRDIYALQNLFKHSDTSITERYIGIHHDHANKTRMEVDFGI